LVCGCASDAGDSVATSERRDHRAGPVDVGGADSTHFDERDAVNKMPVQDARSLCEPLVKVCLHCSKVNKAPPELMNVNRGNGTEQLRYRTAGIVRSAHATQGGSIGAGLRAER
jgi:hypothetical protein